MSGRRLLAIGVALAAPVLAAAPVAAQLVTSPTPLANGDGKGGIRLETMAAKVKPPQPRGTVIEPCPGTNIYRVVKGVVPCPAVQPAPPIDASPFATGPSRNVHFDRQHFGVNLSGCEFADSGSLCPTAKSLGEYLDKGFTAFRVPFRGKQATNPAIIAKLVALTNAAAVRGAYVILDRHDYGAPFNAAQVPFWTALLRHFTAHDHIMVDTMNEPKGGRSYQPDANGLSFATDVNEGIAAFRAAGHRNTLLIEWKGSSGMGRFAKNEPSRKACESPACSFDRAGGLKDPLGQTMVSGHGYPDGNGSGTSQYCAADKASGAWVSNGINGTRQRGVKVWVGEIAFARHDRLSATCRAVATGTIARFRDNADAVAGVTWWGGGAPWKEDYHYKIEPKKGSFATAPNSPYLELLLGR